MSITKVGRIGIESLNESAALVFAGRSYISRRPSTPTFWFYTLAIDAKAHTFGPDLLAALSDESKALLELLDVSSFETAQDYCTCVDESWLLVPYLGANPGVRGGLREPCWPCLFGSHERCCLGCTSSGEIHFPETIIDPRVKAAA